MVCVTNVERNARRDGSMSCQLCLSQRKWTLSAEESAQSGSAVVAYPEIPYPTKLFPVSAPTKLLPFPFACFISTYSAGSMPFFSSFFTSF